LKGGGSSLPSDTAERIRHGNVPADTPPSATKKAAAASSQFEIDNDLAQLMKKGYTREQAYQVVQQAMAQQQKQQQQQQQLLQQRQIHEQSYSASEYGSVEPNHSASVHSRYSQVMVSVFHRLTIPYSALPVIAEDARSIYFSRTRK